MWKYTTLNSKRFRYADLSGYLSQPFTGEKNIILSNEQNSACD